MPQLHIVGQPGVYATHEEVQAEVKRLRVEWGIDRDCGPAKKPARARNIPEPNTDPVEEEEGVMTQ
jgi:hypothetical protein